MNNCVVLSNSILKWNCVPGMFKIGEVISVDKGKGCDNNNPATGKTMASGISKLFEKNIFIFIENEMIVRNFIMVLGMIMVKY